MTTLQAVEPAIDRLSFDKIHFFPDHLSDLVAGRDAYPIHMQVGPVNFCNHDCTFCYAARSMFDAIGVGRSRIDVERLFEITEEMHGLGLRAVTLVGSGEPTLHPRIADIITGIHERGVDVGMFSNGSCITDKTAHAIAEHMTFVRFSLTGASREVHDLVHANHDFDRVVANIKRVAQARTSRLPTLGVQFVLASYSAGDLIKGVKLAKDIGLDYFEIKPCYIAPNKPDQLPNTLTAAQSAPLIEEALKLADDDFHVYGKLEQHQAVAANVDDRRYDDCPGHKTMAVLEADMNLYICVNQKIADFCFGNLKDKRFADVWHSDRRKDILEKLDVHECQPRCRQDPINKIVHEIRVGERTISLNMSRPTPEMHASFL